MTMLSEGTEAPQFELPNQDGEPVNLADYRGRWVVLYFYPRADTPGCTTQACGIRDRNADYEAANAVVLGVSPDSPDALRKFADKYGLAFTLLGDEEHAVADAYGTWGEKKNYGKTYMGVQRATFLIDPGGVVRHVIPKVKPATHDQEVLAALGELEG
ncbi:MAG: thioredoxin-dependent peroxiredoxin [Thermoleophilales bacterium]|jgi:peroxiredoxin Q/BCP|nr:thioredoxin-dependent peroxiredoxin [Thermoleophilales bacterium]